MFICDDDTAGECFDLGLFGRKNPTTGDIALGKTLFLYHRGKDVIYGPFVAASSGRDNIMKYAFRERFPRQVLVAWRGGPTSYLAKGEIQDLITFGEKGLPQRTLNLAATKELIRRLDEKKNRFPRQPEPHVTYNADFRERYPGKFRATDGHMVQSKAELVIDNWLYNRRIFHIPEKSLEIEEKCYCDFYLPDQDIYVEYWGLNDPEYNRRKETKQGIYKKYSLKLVELTESDMEKLEDVLPKKMKVLLAPTNPH